MNGGGGYNVGVFFWCGGYKSGDKMMDSRGRVLRS